MPGGGGGGGDSRREGQHQPQDALTCTMGPSASTLQRLVLFLALLATPTTRARSPTHLPAPGPPRLHSLPSQSIRWRWWLTSNPPFPLQGAKPPLLWPPAQARLGADGPMERPKVPRDVIGQVLEETVVVDYKAEGGTLVPPDLTGPHLSWHPQQSSRRDKFLQNGQAPLLQTGSDDQRDNGQNSPSSRSRRKAVDKKQGPETSDPTQQLGPQRVISTGSRLGNRQPHSRHPADVLFMLTLPSVLLRPLLPSLPLQRRAETGPSGSRSPISGVEIVGLKVQTADADNTTVVLMLRDYLSSGQLRHMAPDRQVRVDRPGPLSRSRRSYRRRMGYGRNARFRARLLAHRLSISYRHVQPCSYRDRFYCMNGGICVFVGALDIKTCRCPIGYTGVRCELIDQEYILSLLTDSIIFS